MKRHERHIAPRGRTDSFRVLKEKHASLHGDGGDNVDGCDNGDGVDNGDEGDNGDVR